MSKYGMPYSQESAKLRLHELGLMRLLWLLRQMILVQERNPELNDDALRHHAHAMMEIVQQRLQMVIDHEQGALPAFIPVSKCPVLELFIRDHYTWFWMFEDEEFPSYRIPVDALTSPTFGRSKRRRDFYRRVTWDRLLGRGQWKHYPILWDDREYEHYNEYDRYLEACRVQKLNDGFDFQNTFEDDD